MSTVARRSLEDASFEKDLVALIPAMRAFSRSLLAGNVGPAEDLAQEALARAWAARQSFTPGTNMKAWVFMIIRNQFFSEKRRSWREVGLDQTFAETTLRGPDSAQDILTVNDVRLALEQLPDDQREALILVGAGGLTYDEAAVITSSPVGTVKSRVSRARKHLAHIMAHGEVAKDSLPAGQAMDAILADVPLLAA